jgi:hypothetical protein
VAERLAVVDVTFVDGAVKTVLVAVVVVVAVAS